MWDRWGVHVVFTVMKINDTHKGLGENIVFLPYLKV